MTAVMTGAITMLGLLASQPAIGQVCIESMAEEVLLCDALRHNLGPTRGADELVLSRLEDCITLAHASKVAGLDPPLVIALAWHESRLHPGARSKGAARGLLQVIPSQLKRYTARLQQSAEPWVAGLWTLDRWLRRHRGRVIDALAGYNGGNSPPDRSFRWARSVAQLAKELRHAR